jgi:uncharacterized protein YuzE
MGFTGQTFQNKNVVEDLIIEIEAEGKVLEIIEFRESAAQSPRKEQWG